MAEGKNMKIKTNVKAGDKKAEKPQLVYMTYKLTNTMITSFSN